MAETPLAQTLFEVSWEVCNKVGGIYTVVRSKVPFIKKYYQNYVVIGPLTNNDYSREFDPVPVPAHWQPVFAELEAQGIKCQYGTWLVAGEPTAILIDFQALFAKKNELKHQLWERFQIDSLSSAYEFEEPLCFATAAGMLIASYASHYNQNEKIVAQCHEWIAGFALLHLKNIKAHVATVFTTHATMLGRTIAGNGHALYDIMDKIDPKEWAYRYNVQDKHLTEVACAHNADVFTTVSEITGMEAERLLGKKPDVLTLNGFYIDKFPTFEETSIRHNQSREVLRDFVAYMFFPYYAFDIDKTLIFFTSGRYEFQNKGNDVLIEALARLNDQLKAEKVDITIIMFFWVIMGKSGIKSELVESKNHFTRLKSEIEWHSKPLLHKVLLDFLSNKVPGKDDLFTSNFIRSLREDVRHAGKAGTPPIATHDLGYADDPTLKACQQFGLTNKKEDRVKVIVYPGYLDGSDGLLDMQYYDATVGAHLGIFPSGYEPWGYTPLEAAMLGVPAITTDLAGFGRYILTLHADKGIIVLPRISKSHDDVVTALANKLHEYSLSDANERVQNGFTAKTLASHCDWKNFIAYYIIAHNKAVERNA